MKKLTKLITLSIVVIVITYSYSAFLEDTQDKIMSRLEWNRSKQQEISRGKISFAYSEDTGTYCKAEKDLFYHETALKIPASYLICGCKIIFILYFIKLIIY